MQTALDGALTVSSTCGTMHMHLSVLEQMKVLMGPQSYDHVLRMATGVSTAALRVWTQSQGHHQTSPCDHVMLPAGNLAEAHSAFEPVLVPPLPRVWNTQFSKGMAFGPSASEVPYFLLTADWPTLQVCY